MAATTLARGSFQDQQYSKYRILVNRRLSSFKRSLWTSISFAFEIMMDIEQIHKKNWSVFFYKIAAIPKMQLFEFLKILREHLLCLSLSQIMSVLF